MLFYILFYSGLFYSVIILWHSISFYFSIIVLYCILFYYGILFPLSHNPKFCPFTFADQPGPIPYQLNIKLQL